MSTSPIKVSIIGAGSSYSTFHLPLVLHQPDLFTLHSVLERSATPTSSKARSALPSDALKQSVKIVNTIEDVMSDPDVELVIITTINDTHYEFAKAALQAGKNVLVEKPTCPTENEVKELGEIAKEKRVLLVTYQNRRFDADFLTVQKVMREGKMGDVIEFGSSMDRYRPVPKGGWKEVVSPGTGLIFDLGSHLVDQALVLFGLPSKITALAENSRLQGPSEVDDSFTIILHYPASPNRKLPLKAILRASVLSLMTPALRYSIKGTTGSFLKYEVDPQESQLKASVTAPSSDSYGVDPESAWATLESTSAPSNTAVGEKIKYESVPGSYPSFYTALGKAIRGEGEPPVTVQESIDLIRVLGLAHQSSREGRTLDV